MAHRRWSAPHSVPSASAERYLRGLNFEPRAIEREEHRLINLFLRFAAAGAVGTGVHYLALIFLVSWLGSSPALGAIIGASCGAVMNYYLNRKFNFAGSGEHRHAVPRFILMVAVGVFLNGLIVKILTGGGVHFLVAQMAATVFILGVNFIVCKKWIFIKIK